MRIVKQLALTLTLLALVAGLFLGNVTKRFAVRLADAAKPEWYIKTAIVFLGVNLGAQTMQASSFALDLILAGAAALAWRRTIEFVRQHLA